MGFMVSPSAWERAHAAGIFAGQKHEAEHGTLPNTPMWRMLEYRHDLNPARFDHWHPNIGIILEHRDHHAIVPPHHWIGHMRGPSLSCEPLPALPPPPQQGSQTVPEPAASTMLAMAFVLVGAWWFMTKRKG